MDHHRYKAWVTKQIGAIQRAEWQVDSFARCFQALDAAGIKLTAGQIADWLQDDGVKCSRKNAKWTAKTVEDRLFIDQRLQVETVEQFGMTMIGMYRGTEHEHYLENVRKALNDQLPTPQDTIENAIRAMADWLRERVDAVAKELRQGQKSFD
jgi:hypothetical protein